MASRVLTVTRLRCCGGRRSRRGRFAGVACWGRGVLIMPAFVEVNIDFDAWDVHRGVV